MRVEVTNWLKQAEADLKSARNSRASGDYHMSVFASHQAAEKALKALFLFKFKDFPKGHSIIFFAQKVKVPKEMLTGIRDLNPEYLSTRYPDIAVGIPAELYDDEIAGGHYATAERIVEWVHQQIQE